MQEVLGETVDASAPLSQVGLDSIGALEFRAVLEDRLSTSLPATLLFDHPTAEQVATFLAAASSETSPKEEEGMPLSSVRGLTPPPALGPARASAADGVAVLGAAVRFPGEQSHSLEVAEDCISVVPVSRWDVEQHGMSTLEGSTATRWAAFLATSSLTLFDCVAFGMSRAEAVFADPQQRILLEMAHEALLDRQHPPSRPPDSTACGVYVGIYPPEYSTLTAASGSAVTAYHATGATSSAAAGRISYVFGLRGPCLSVDTACSSSLIGLHIGVAHVRASSAAVGASPSAMAAAFGVNVILNPAVLHILGTANMLSPRGRCAAIDASADG